LIDNDRLLQCNFGESLNGLVNAGVRITYAWAQ